MVLYCDSTHTFASLAAEFLAIKVSALKHHPSGLVVNLAKDLPSSSHSDHEVVPATPQSEVLVKFFEEIGEKCGEILAKFLPSICRENGRKKFHEKSSTFSMVHQIKFFHCCNSGGLGPRHEGTDLRSGKEKTHKHKNEFGGLSRDWVGVKHLLKCFGGSFLMEGGRERKHINEIPRKSRDNPVNFLFLCVSFLCFFFFCYFLVFCHIRNRPSPNVDVRRLSLIFAESSVFLQAKLNLGSADFDMNLPKTAGT